MYIKTSFDRIAHYIMAFVFKVQKSLKLLNKTLFLNQHFL